MEVSFVIILVAIAISVAYLVLMYIMARSIISPTKIVLFVGLIFFVGGSIILVFLSESDKADKWLISSIIIFMGIFLGYSINLTQNAIEKSKYLKKIKDLEDQANKNKQDTRIVWELANTSMQFYIDQNIKNVRSVFNLAVVSMIVGFLLIIFGIYNLYESPVNPNPNTLSVSVLSAVSGIVVNFIGATFMVLYKSTMNQAQKYMSVLERINAVGMSMRILEAIDNDNYQDLKQNTTANVATELLQLYRETKT